LTGRNAVVTGANSGLGYETALQLAAHGAHVVIAVRDENRGRQACARIADAMPVAQLEVQVLDLADLASVRRFAAAYASGHDGLDILVNNAGIMAHPYGRTVDGFEKQLATNHLGHFALTGQLLPSLLSRPGARVVSVSSRLADSGWLNFDDLHGERGYDANVAYSQSKLANLLFALELDRRACAVGVDLISVAAHPGIAATNLFQYRGNWASHGGSPADGARHLLRAATDPTIRRGQYVGPRSTVRGKPTVVKAPKQALDHATAARLWAVSEQLTGISYEALAS
jgi:NAD(P)-dependent dehydrogenase (short-subunit alcohol dehydrogenase family)